MVALRQVFSGIISAFEFVRLLVNEGIESRVKEVGLSGGSWIGIGLVRLH
jgi:hypothetical protein